MMTKNRAQIIIETTQCTHFAKIKLCAFILASFKNAIDCIMIDSPLKDTIPVARIKDDEDGKTDKIFAPLVTSKTP